MKITHDFHIHTNLSECAKPYATVELYVDVAKHYGLKKLGFANHFWDSAIPGATEWYKPQDFEHLLKIKPEIEWANKQGLEVLFGCEGEYDCKNHSIAITPEVAEQFDFIIIPNSHTHIVMPKEFCQVHEKHMNFMIEAYEDIINCDMSRYITAIAHPFEACGRPDAIDVLFEMIPDDTYKRLFDKTAEKGIAIEINLSAMRGKTEEEIAVLPQMRMYNIAKDCGCKFIFGSDAHNLNGHWHYSNADVVAELLSLKEDDIAEIAR